MAIRNLAVQAVPHAPVAIEARPVQLYIYRRIVGGYVRDPLPANGGDAIRQAYVAAGGASKGMIDLQTGLRTDLSTETAAVVANDAMKVLRDAIREHTSIRFQAIHLLENGIGAEGMSALEPSARVKEKVKFSEDIAKQEIIKLPATAVAEKVKIAANVSGVALLKERVDAILERAKRHVEGEKQGHFEAASALDLFAMQYATSKADIQREGNRVLTPNGKKALQNSKEEVLELIRKVDQPLQDKKAGWFKTALSKIPKIGKLAMKREEEKKELEEAYAAQVALLRCSSQTGYLQGANHLDVQPRQDDLTVALLQAYRGDVPFASLAPARELLFLIRDTNVRSQVADELNGAVAAVKEKRDRWVDKEVNPLPGEQRDRRAPQLLSRAKIEMAADRPRPAAAAPAEPLNPHHPPGAAAAAAAGGAGLGDDDAGDDDEGGAIVDIAPPEAPADEAPRVGGRYRDPHDGEEQKEEPVPGEFNAGGWARGFRR